MLHDNTYISLCYINCNESSVAAEEIRREMCLLRFHIKQAYLSCSEYFELPCVCFVKKCLEFRHGGLVTLSMNTF